ncbi:MAG: ABC transporter ATP-binding protein [Gammaproteobacteria bacterium]|nr:ABC transporter ATP-binding protein [Gammaproteobacteria bacterium]
MSSILLSAKELSRYYGQQQAVQNVSFEVKKGEVLGFLGPNGAGKSTTMKMLSGNLSPNHGEIIINGYDLLTEPKLAKSHIGYLPEQPPLYKELTVKEFLLFCAKINQIHSSNIKKSVDTAIERCGLSQVHQRLIGNLSKGYQQRVGIAQAIIHTPAVVILDEPTSGLDPIQIREIRHLIRDIATEHSVILSTHILPEVEMLCDRVQIINQGELILSDTIEGFGQHMQTSRLLLGLATPPAINVLQNIAGVVRVVPISNTQFNIHYTPDNNPINEIVGQAAKQHWQLNQLTPQQHSLEDTFMKIIRNEAHSDEQGV